MPSERQRILELALESLHSKKKQIDDEIADLIRSKYPKQELEIHEGGQPHYQFIISVE